MRKVLAAIIFAATSASPVFAQTSVKIIVGGMDKQIYLPAKLADSLGFFKEQGLDVQLFNTTSGSSAETSLVAREVQGVVGFYDHTIDLQAKGKLLTDVVQFGIAPGEAEMVTAKEFAKYSNPANWKGQALGVTGLGSATDFLTRYIAGNAGLKPQDYTIVPVGAGNTFLAAVKQGKIVVGMTTEPTISRGVKDGTVKVAIDMRTPSKVREALGGDYCAASLYMNRGWMEENKPTVQKLVNAFVKTLKWMHTHTAEQIADKMPKDYYAGDKSLYVKGLHDGKSQYSPDGMMPAQCPEHVLKVLSAYNPAMKGKTIDLSKTYTTEFVAKANATH